LHKEPVTTVWICFDFSSELLDPKKNEWFETEDRAEWKDNYVKILGRQGNFYKIGGESVDLNRLQHLLQDLKLKTNCTYDAEVIAVADERLGHVIHLVTTNSDCHKLADAFNLCVMPFEKIRKTVLVQTIPRTPLKGIMKYEL